MGPPKIGGDDCHLKLVTQELRTDEPEGARQGGASAPESVVSQWDDPYLARITDECMACRREVERLLSPIARNPALVEEIVSQGVWRVVQYAANHRADKKVGSAKALLLVTARNLLKDAQSKKLKADKLPTLSWDDEANEGLMNRPDDSPAREMLKRAEAARLREVLLGVATDEEKEMFRLWFEEDMTEAEIAPRLGVCSATVKHRMDRLFAKVRSALKGHP